MEIWQEKHTLPFSAVDRSDRLTAAAAFGFLEEAAINDAERLGVGRYAMLESGRVWVLSRLAVQMERRPRWKENITVRSWPKGWEKLFALRDYDIRDENGEIAVRGTSCWIVLDLEKRRPLRPQTVMESLPKNEGLDALCGGTAALEERSDLSKKAERRAAYSDIDYNGHVNNTRYIQWIQDIAEPEFLENAETIRLDINYLGEVKYGEVIDLFAGSIETGFAFEGRRKDGGAAVFRAELFTRSGHHT
ncbi:acyl-ACP thioesterase [Spirochaetia bacterium]|nr:acyl-ACP thioesterase [Spirochaetia bacterium]